MKKRKWHQRPRRADYKHEQLYMDDMQVWLLHRYPYPDDEFARQAKWSEIEYDRIQRAIWCLQDEIGWSNIRYPELVALREELRMHRAVLRG